MKEYEITDGLYVTPFSSYPLLAPLKPKLALIKGSVQRFDRLIAYPEVKLKQF